MFLDTWHTTLSDDGVLALPAELRTQFADGMVITCGFERCLQIFPRSAWDALAQRVNALPLGDVRARHLRRLLFGCAQDTAPDASGQVPLSQRLRGYGALEGSVVVTGMHSYLEVWSETLWQDVQRGLSVNAASLAELLPA